MKVKRLKIRLIKLDTKHIVGKLPIKNALQREV